MNASVRWVLVTLIVLLVALGAFSITSAIAANHRIIQTEQAVSKAQLSLKQAFPAWGRPLGR